MNMHLSSVPLPQTRSCGLSSLSLGTLARSIRFLDATTLASTLLVDPESLDPQLLLLSFGFSLRRRGIETRLVVGERVPEPDPALLRALADAHKEMAERRAGRARTDIEASSRPSGSRMRRRSYLAFLSPRIQQAILAGQVPESLGLEKLLRTYLPLDWREQEKCLGFDTLLR